MNFDLSKKEKEILKFWEDKKIFQKSLKKRKKEKPFVFYEGPPTANGMPGIHHVLTRAFKDIICRFKTMEGFYVERRAGWDTHGLPVELQVEKEMGMKSKKDIEEYGIGKFNQKCKKSVWKYKKEWENLTKRIGFWLDMERPYITYDADYIETLFSIIKNFYEKGLLYEDKKIVPWCPRCQTALSSHEVAQGYKKIEEPSIFFKLKVKSEKLKIIVKNSKLENTYFLAWTTTPWTLPGNVALAINTKIDYVLLKADSRGSKRGLTLKRKEHYILAKKRVEKVFGNQQYKIIKEFKGKELLGLKYEPLYPVASRQSPVASYFVIAGDFVTTEEGTGIVHIAPAFGEDDFKAAKENNLPQLITVKEDGKMGEGVIGEGKFVKSADPLIVEDLKKRNLLFLEEMYEHDYPFCWRCKSPLIYYLHPSWFVGVSKIRKKLTGNNKKINWVPSYLKEGRFGKFLEEARDWNFSRERYWGTPLPVWRCGKCRKIEVIGSKDDIKKQKFSNNRYFILRHGLSENNAEGIVSDDPQKYSLTREGRIQIKRAAKKIRKEKINIILSSDILRCRETAEIIGKELDIKPRFFEELREIKMGVLNGYSSTEYRKFFYEEEKNFYKNYKKKVKEKKFYKKPEGGETWQELKVRMYNFLKKVEEKYQSKNILIVSHEDPLICLQMANEGISNKEEYRKTRLIKKEISNGECFKLKFIFFPYNEKGELDFHRPYIDEVKFSCPLCFAKMERVEEVADCWFDSGSMPLAQAHWPFAQKPKAKSKNMALPELFPADFICEAIDQTRGWFYTLLAVSSLLGFGSPYKNVISVGHVLDGKGEKMSKSKGNIVDPWQIIEKYGVDALRWYFYTINQPGDSKMFDEREVKKSFNKFILTFYNSHTFYKTYAKPREILRETARNNISVNQRIDQRQSASTLLDKWIVSRLQGLIEEVKNYLDKFDIVSAAREIEKFTLDDLSNWYIRRSRQRFQRPKTKNELKQASNTLGFVLLELSKVAAPFIPFLSEEIYQNIAGKNKSVHFEDFPKTQRKLRDKKLEEKMEKIKEIVAEGLTKRKEAGIKVRQPLASLKFQISNFKFQNELMSLIKDELNVKEVKTENKKGGLKVELDTEITPQLKEEGIVREIVRAIQGMRKSGGLKKENKIKIFFDFPNDLAETVKQNKGQIKKETIAVQITKEKNKSCTIEKEFNLDTKKVWLGIKKI